MIYSFPGLELSLSRAFERALPGYAEAYAWYAEHEGLVGPRPYGENTPADAIFPWAAQRGIHKPGGNKNRYALCVSSSGKSVYSADEVNYLDDGTWVFQYCAHRRNAGEREGSQVYNLSLLKCLEDGMPVGVFVKERAGGSRCLGLAFVERFDTSSGMFLLRGPARINQDPLAFSIASGEEIQQIQSSLKRKSTSSEWAGFDSAWAEADPFTEYDAIADEDARERRLAEVVRRKKQGEFRRALIEAYEGRCTMSGYDALDALQAAHITSYFGPKSQMVTNGLLLRADLHILYDRSMLSVDPATMKITVGPELESTEYGVLDGQEIRLPRNPRYHPSTERLAAQFAAFVQASRAAC